MPTEIKYTAGDKVYWLSSKGFTKGIIKQVLLTDIISIYNGKHKKRKEIQYFLWSVNSHDEYMGDEVKEHEIFTNYKDMIKYYSSIKL